MVDPVKALFELPFHNRSLFDFRASIVNTNILKRHHAKTSRELLAQNAAAEGLFY